MRVELADVISSENKEMSKQAEIELLSFDSKLGQFPVVKKEPFVLTFTNEENRRLSIQGETEVTIAIPCGRCLEEVEQVFRLTIEKEISLEGGSEETAMDGFSFMAGTSLDVDQLIFGEILVGWPMFCAGRTARASASGAARTST